MSNLYKRLEAAAPTIEQIAAHKRRRKQRLSKKEIALLDERLAEKRHRRSIAKNPALKIKHPERNPSKPIITQGAMYGAIRNPPDE